MTDDITRALRRQIAQLQATQTYLRVAASKALPFPNVWRAEGRAEQRCHELLAQLGMELGRLKRSSSGTLSQSAAPRLSDPGRRVPRPGPQARASGPPASRRDTARPGPRRSSGLVTFDDTPSDAKPAHVPFDEVEDEDRTLIGPQPGRPAQGSTGRATARASTSAPTRGRPTNTRGRPVTGARRGTPSQPLVRTTPGPQSRWGRGGEARAQGRGGRLEPGRDALVTVDEEAPNINDDIGAYDSADEEKLFGDEGATVVGEAPPSTRQTPTPAAPPPPSPARVTSSLYGGSSVPSVRASSTRPRAAAVQLNTTGTGGRVVGLEDDIEPIEIGSAEDDDEFVEPAGGGFSVTLHQEEWDESDAAYVEEDDEAELDMASELPEPPDEDPRTSAAEVAQMYAEARNVAAGGDLNAAADLFSDVIDADPDHVEAHVARGRVFLDLGDYSRAMSDFMVAEEIAQDNPEPQVAIGDLYFARKDYRRAIEYFNAALDLDPEHAMAFCRRGISHYYRKNYNDALEDLLHAQQLRPDIPNLTTYVAMAQKKKQRKKRP